MIQTTNPPAKSGAAHANARTRDGNSTNRHETTFRSLMADFRSRQCLDAEAIQSFADQFSRLWRERNHLYTNRIGKAVKALQGMMDDMASTGDATSASESLVASTGDATSPSNRKLKEENEEKDEKEEPFPHTPL